MIFNEISAAEMSAMDTREQLALLMEFKVEPEDLENLDALKDDQASRFGKLVQRDGKTLYRYRADDYRIYFELVDDGLLVHRVVHKNTLKDFFYRSNLPVSEDEALSNSKNFWELIEEGQKAARV